MSGLEHAPSWFLVFLVSGMAAIGGPTMAWVAIKYFTSLHLRLDSFDAKFEQLIAGLSAYTPRDQHISAYDKLHAKLDIAYERITRLEERTK